MRLILGLILLISVSLLVSCGSDSQTNEACVLKNCDTNNTNNEEVQNNEEAEEVDNFLLPQKIDIINPPSNELLAKFDDPGTEYSQTIAQKSVSINSFDTIELANFYLCFINKLNLQDYVNSGPYLALIEKGTCDNTPATLIDGVPIVINVTQTNTESPRKFDIWWIGFMTDHELTNNLMDIRVHGEITEGVSESNSRGDYYLSYQITYQNGDLFAADEFISSSLAEEHSYLWYSELAYIEPNALISQSISINNANSGSSDYSYDDGSSVSTVELSFNDSAVLVSNDSALGICYDQASYTEHLNQVALFDAVTGDEIIYNWLDMIFIFEYEDNAETRLGMIDYNGVVLFETVTADFSIFDTGLEVSRQKLNSSTGELESVGLFTLTMPAPAVLTCPRQRDQFLS